MIYKEFKGFESFSIIEAISNHILTILHNADNLVAFSKYNFYYIALYGLNVFFVFIYYGILLVGINIVQSII